MNRVEQMINCVKKRMKSIQEEVKEFSGSKDSVQYKKLYEDLTRCLLELDNIDVRNLTQLRLLRKTTVDNVHLLIEELDSSAAVVDCRLTDDFANLNTADCNKNASLESSYKTVSYEDTFISPPETDIDQLRDTSLAESTQSAVQYETSTLGMFKQKLKESNKTGKEHVSNVPVSDTEENGPCSSSTYFKDSSSENITSLDFENKSTPSGNNNMSLKTKEPDCNLQYEDIEQILNVQLSSFYTQILPPQSIFRLSDEDMIHLNKSQNGRCYQRGHWQHIFANRIAQSNKHCVFMFDSHQISRAKKRRKRFNVPLFKCKGHCKFKDCSVKVYVEMTSPKIVNVYYSRNLKHKVTEQQARPIRATQREIIKESFRNGGKPLRYFLKEYEKKDTDQIISGNCDGVGKDTHVFRQISCESRQIGRTDKDLIQSLLTVMTKSKEDGFGFIQQLSIKPLTIQYWSEEGLRLYHSLAQKDVLFWMQQEVWFVRAMMEKGFFTTKLPLDIL